MPRPHHSEMSAIQSGQLRLAKSLQNRNDGRVHEADVGVGVLIAELTHPPIVGDIQILNLVRTFINVVEQGEQDAGMQALVDPVVHFNEDGGRYHQALTSVVDESTAGSVSGIITIEGCVEQARVED
jgi:hypothetical protein